MGQYVDEETKEVVVRDWDFVQELFDGKVADICKQVGATQAPILFLTGNSKSFGDGYIPNFREAIAVSKGYKDTRKEEKPYHYDNLRAYIQSLPDTRTANGCEADDLICIEQFSRLDAGDTIICTRDKDLRQCPGWHYGWEVGKQAEFGPHCYTALGDIELVRLKSGPKIVGGGFKFFASQLLTGDSVDNIGGLHRWGPVKTYNYLSVFETERDLLRAVRDAYIEQHPKEWSTYLREQTDLLWMVRELNNNGSLKFFNPRDYFKEA